METCQFCGTSLSTLCKSDRENLSGDLADQISYYLLYKRMPESTSSTLGDKQLENLTFSLTISDKTANFMETNNKLCQLCGDELQSLGKLHQELETIQASIKSQVQKLSQIRSNANIPNLEEYIQQRVSLNGSLSDINQICSTLDYLSGICKDFKTSTEIKPEEMRTPNVQASQGNISSIIQSSPGETCTNSTNPVNLQASIISPVQQQEVTIDHQYFLQSVVKYEPSSQETDSMHETIMNFRPTFRNVNVVSSPTNVEGDPLAPDKFSEESSSNSSNMINKKPCPDCGKWVYANYLSLHRKIHTGEKPYICVLCGIRLTQKSSLNKHVKTVHNKTKCAKRAKNF